MRKIITILLLLNEILSVFYPFQTSSQIPQKMNYQAIIRDSSNQVIPNQKIGMRISILQDSVNGNAVYVETQNPVTNTNGLMTIKIGGGSVISGKFSDIDWSVGQFFLQTETDPAGGTNYSITGTQQLLSVPFAFCAGNIILNKTNRPFEMYIKDDGTLMGLPKISVEKPYGLSPTLTDADGNVYATVRIGTQIWMAENLKSTKYRDSTIIPLVTNDSVWVALNAPGYCWSRNDSLNYGKVYGALYNWYTANTAKLCPLGWHVPNDNDWIALNSYLGFMQGGRLKESGSTHWQLPNTDAVNDSKFTALPAGCRVSYDGTFSNIGNYGYWWSATENSETAANSWFLYYDLSIISTNNFGKQTGYSVRCIKDN